MRAPPDTSGHLEPHRANQYLYFATRDLESVLTRVESAGGKIDAPIDTMPWGERMFYAKDPFANPISFVDQ